MPYAITVISAQNHQYLLFYILTIIEVHSVKNRVLQLIYFNRSILVTITEALISKQRYGDIKGPSLKCKHCANKDICMLTNCFISKMLCASVRIMIVILLLLFKIVYVLSSITPKKHQKICKYSVVRIAYL